MCLTKALAAKATVPMALAQICPNQVAVVDVDAKAKVLSEGVITDALTKLEKLNLPKFIGFAAPNKFLTRPHELKTMLEVPGGPPIVAGRPEIWSTLSVAAL